jgi:hypothetical protein
MVRPVRLALMAGALIVLVAVGWGVAAAGTTPTSAKACVTSKGVLAVSTNGACRKGLRRVSVPLSTAIGPRGPQGVQGVAGAPGGLKGYQTVATVGMLTPNSVGPFFATCPAGTEVIGGGALTNGGAGAFLQASYPQTSTEWLVSIDNTTSSTISVGVTALCASVAG